MLRSNCSIIFLNLFLFYSVIIILFWFSCIIVKYLETENAEHINEWEYRKLNLGKNILGYTLNLKHCFIQDTRSIFQLTYFTTVWDLLFFCLEGDSAVKWSLYCLHFQVRYSKLVSSYELMRVILHVKFQSFFKNPV